MPKLAPPKLKPGPKTQFGGPKVDFYPGVELIEQIETFRKEVYAELKISLPRASIFREGAVLFMDKYREKLHAAKKGRLHVKVREDSFFDSATKPKRSTFKKPRVITEAKFRKN